ncbi:MAG: DEAD/DEAH box helicase [Deltaproteobacteria bacterium]|nr:DEAD/DEAH box helicase [Deltaproteobacteria bacterium]
MSFDVGALVRARGREWVVLPESNDEPGLLLLRPLGGTEDEVTGIYLPLEHVEPARFDLPNPATDMGNHLSCGLLRDAVRLGFRSGAGPFRSLARIAVEPRPYQIVPLLMALKLDPVRMLIADDVGIGKTVEACLVARELIDRGEVGGLTVLCPPHLAEQWQKALADQFHISAELVLSATAARLERTCRQDESLFERYPFTVVSTDYIKSDRRRDEFLRTCPDLVIVDEAHTCAAAPGRSASQQRHELLRALVAPSRPDSASRHLILVTATPHSGNEETFRSLLSLLDGRFGDLPEDLSGENNRKRREDLARHFVQRRRADLEAYLDTVTPFPKREIAENHYTLSADYRRFLDRVLAFCRESVLDETLEKRRQRVRWWSALALLRALASSPAAAAATLRNRSATADGETVDQVDEEGRRAVLDLDEENAEGIDVIPGSETGDEDAGDRDRLLRLAREADALAGTSDVKLHRAFELVQQFLNDGYAPILFCRFIPTVEYVAGFLREKLERKGVVVEAVTGLLPPEERERRVEALGAHDKRVLVCTDCLSEGINLQQHFDAVMHYDLSWNPTRHEQREGRVDRYGQPKKQVRTLTYYGQDNPVDGIVLQVLLRKHKAIHKQLGVIVPVPMETKIIEDAILEGLLIREHKSTTQLTFEFLEPIHRAVDVEWDAAVEREKRSRTLFAQNQLLTAVNTEVRAELEEVRRVIGAEADVRRFTRTALRTLGAVVSGDEPLRVDLRETSRALKDAVGHEEGFGAVFSGAPRKGTLLLTRTHPVVEGLAAHVLETALDEDLVGPGRRCGVVRTSAVDRRTTLLLLRIRFHLVNQGRDGNERPLLAEDLVLAGFTGSPERAEWLPPDTLEPLLDVDADTNIGADQAQTHIRRVLDRFEDLLPRLDQIAEERGQALLDAHRRVRKATKSGVRALKVDVHKPADVLGVYVYLPAAMGGIG